METVYPALLAIHSWLRWVVLILALVVIIRGAMGMSSKGPFTNGDRKNGLFFMISCDIQLLIGLLLYFWASPLGVSAFQTMGGEVMKNSELRYYAVEHIFVMIVAIVLVHIGYSKNKKAVSDLTKHKTALIFYGIALLLMLSRIPVGSRPLFR
ncbi:MAG: hypothetical protein QM669_14715 [Siphonobacter sp.]